jgi:hypothetical protein
MSSTVILSSGSKQTLQSTSQSSSYKSVCNTYNINLQIYERNVLQKFIVKNAMKFRTIFLLTINFVNNCIFNKWTMRYYHKQYILWTRVHQSGAQSYKVTL